MNILKKLIFIIKQNKKKSSKVSYTAFLIKKGSGFCINKFMEESKELSHALKKNIRKNIISESADMLYHFFVLLELKKIKFSSILRELQKRQKISGIEEKLSRKNVRYK
jgi:phosphoribosyl-ATP pyrophosphohydrolase